MNFFRKSKLKIALVVIIGLSLSCCLTACSNKASTDDGATDTSTSSDTGGDIVTYTDTGTGTSTHANTDTPPDSDSDSDADADKATVVASGITVSNEAVRACDLVLAEQPGTRIKNVVYAATARGRHQSRPPKTAISVIATSDTPFSGSLIELKISNEASTVAPTLPTFVSVQCYDKQGSPVADSGINIQ